MFKKLSYKKLSFGYNFEENKEIISLISINYFYLILFSAVVIMLHIGSEELLPVSYRYHAIIIIAVLNLLLIKYNRIRMAQLCLMILIPFLLMILPVIAKLYDNEFYFWFPYLPIAFSLTPHLILHPQKDKILLTSILTVYFFLGLFIDNLMIHYSEMEEEIIPIVIENRFYYNLIPAIFFAFVNITIGLLFLQNNKYETRLKMRRVELEEKNSTLSNQKEELLSINTNMDRTLKQLHETQSKLIQSEKLAALGTLSAGIAHEINNPLNFISGSLEEIGEIMKQHPEIFKNASENIDEDDPDQHFLELIQFAKEGVLRTTDIVAKLGLLKSRGSKSLKKTALTELIDSALIDFQVIIPQYIKISKNIPEDLHIECLVPEIQKVIQTILSNSINAIATKEIKDNEEISITAFQEIIEKKNYVTISISNSGPLIPQSEIHKIFDPFYTTKNIGEGVGLGLSVSYNTIHQHKGIISAENGTDQVLFKISLPVIS